MKKTNHLVSNTLRLFLIALLMILSGHNVSAQYHEVKLFKDFDFTENTTLPDFWYRNYTTINKGSKPTLFTQWQNKLYLITKDSFYYFSNSSNANEGSKAFAKRPDYATSLIIGSNMFYKNDLSLYVSNDGYSEGTRLLLLTSPGNDKISSLFQFKGKCYFFVMRRSAEVSLYESDGTFNGTKVVKDLPWFNLFNGSPTVLYNGNKFYFSWDSGIWESDGTEGGTKLLVRGPGLNGYTLSPIFHNDKLYFIGEEPATGRDLWVVDDLVQGTSHIVLDYTSGESGSLNNASLYSLLGKLYINMDGGDCCNGGLAVYEPIQNTIIPLKMEFRHSLRNIFTYKNKVVFLYSTTGERNADNYDFIYYETDGTVAGTKPFLNQELNWSRRSDGFFTTEYNNKLYFSANSTASPDVKLWVTDGTSLKPVKDAKGMTFYEGAVFDSKLFLSAYEPSMGQELYTLEEKITDHIVPTVKIEAINGYTDPIVYVEAAKSGGIASMSVVERYYKVTNEAGVPLQNVILGYTFSGHTNNATANLSGYYPSFPSDANGVAKIVLPSYLFANFSTYYFTSMDVAFDKVITVNDVVYEKVTTINNGFKAFKINFEVSTPLKIGLIAHYPLNGNANDVGPFGLHGAYTNYDDFGNGQKGAKFTNNSYIKLPSKERFANKKFSLSASFKADNSTTTLLSNTGYTFTINKGDDPTNTNIFSVGGLLTSTTTNTGHRVPKLIGINIKDIAHHVVLTCDASFLKLYYNGKIASTYVFSPNENLDYYTNTSEVIMGFFKGLLQNIRFYDRAIEPQEVELLYKIDSDKKIIESIYPTSCGSGTPLTTYIKGSGFTKDCIVGLKESVGSRIIYDKKVTFVSPTELIVDWDLPNDAILTYGKYDIQISGFIDGSVQTKSKAFTIKEHIPSILDVNIDGGSNSFGNGALPLQTKLVNDQTGQYRVRIKATGNVPLFNVEESIVIQCLDNDSKLQFFTSPVIQGEKIFGTTQPRSEISYTEGIDDNGFKTYTIIMSKKILYPEEKPELFFSLYSKRAPTKFVIGTQNALKSYNSTKREQACSDCEKCVLDLISAAPGPIGCAASIGGAYCTSLEKPAWYDIIRTIGSATLSCAFPFGNIVGKFSQKVIGAASGGIGALADCQAALRFGCNSSFEGPIEVQVVQRSGIISDDTLRSNTLQTQNTNSNISFNIYGLKGYTNENYVARGQVMPYKIVFNNLSSNDTVNTVIIKEQIDTSIFDISSFSFSNYGFGDTTFILDNTNENFIAYDHDLRPRKNTILRFTAFIDRDSGKIEWHLSSINPNTYDPIVDKKQGFLPPNDSTGKGLGFLEYTIDSKTNLVHGSKIRSQVDVQVDSTLSITTPTWMNTIDAEKPISKIKSLSAISTDTTIQLIFQGSDSGSGIKYYDLFMSENNSPIRRVGTNIKKDTIKFTGTNGRTYAFFSMARDSVGNWEDTTHIADAITKIDIRTPVSEVHSKNIKIYPNPNNGIFLIESPWDNTSIQVSINDWAGRILTQQKFEPKHTVEIQLKNVPFGIYYLSVKNEKTGEIKVAKFVYQ